MAKILLIEDNENNIYLMEFLLRKAGHEVEVARTGKEGIDIGTGHEFALIITDVQLPDIDGLEVVRRIRDSELGKRVPIVAVTSYAMVGDRERALEAGCSGYIEKPINPETFVKEIQEFIFNRAL